MNTSILKLLDSILFWAHAVVAGFCVIGWTIPGVERWHLGLIVLIGFSWYGLGAFKGIGYCFLTDWQWRVREAMGMSPEHGSFVQLMLERFSGLKLHEQHIKWFAYGIYWLCALFSVVVNFFITL